MKDISIDELKKIQLDILDDVTQFCDKNNIHYFLSYGTLIGAVRHHGYIPWDDDIDIAMPRPDYDRFVRTYKGEGGKYEVVAFPKLKSYALPFAKVHHTETVMDEYLYEQDIFGVYIDLFPIDAFVDEAQVLSAHRWRMLLNAKKAILFSGGRSLRKDVSILLAKMLLCFIPVKTILCKIDRLSRKIPYESAERVGYIPSLNSNLKDIVDKRLLESCVEADFEGRLYKIPVGYDAYLRSLYGDYMQLPPKEQRVSHHTFKAWWK